MQSKVHICYKMYELYTQSCVLISLQVATTLSTMNDRSVIDANIDAALCPLTDKEQEVKEHIRRVYFEPLHPPHWEGVEVLKYWEEIKKAK